MFWTCHINTLVKKARQRLYHLRRLRDIKLPSQVLKTFYTCTIESVLTGSITSRFGNSTMLKREEREHQEQREEEKGEYQERLRKLMNQRARQQEIEERDRRKEEEIRKPQEEMSSKETAPDVDV